MECPKCHSKHIRRVAVISRHSQLADSPTIQPWVDGYSCPICGYWADVMEETPGELPVGRLVKTPGPTVSLAHICRTNFERIQAMRESQTWQEVADWIHQGHGISPSAEVVSNTMCQVRSARRKQENGPVIDRCAALRRLMELKGATISALSDTSGVSERTIGKCRRGFPITDFLYDRLIEVLNTREFRRDRRGRVA